jgi:hypothetical protein
MELTPQLVTDVLLPALGAGVVAVLATVAVERLGGAAGGIVSSVPTTIVPAAIGIHAAAADDASFRRAMCFVPVGILLNAGYLMLWRVLPVRLRTGFAGLEFGTRLYLGVCELSAAFVSRWQSMDRTDPDGGVTLPGYDASFSGFWLGFGIVF